MADKLSLYNLALVYLGKKRIASLSQVSEERVVFDDLYGQAVQLCLEEAMWNFMLRATQIDASPSIAPAFGYSYAFPIPSDWLRTTLVSSTETFVPPLLDYTEEAGVWYADATPLYVKYQSRDRAYGMDLSRWTANFTQYLALQLAEMGCLRITGTNDLILGPDGLSRRLYRAKTKAKSNDAMNEGPQEMPTGTWARSRRGFLRGVPAPGGTSFDD